MIYTINPLGLIILALTIILTIVFLVTLIFIFVRKSKSKTTLMSEELNTNSKQKLKSVFIEPTEEYVSSLGNGYIVNFLANSNVLRGFSIISDKRVYFKGDCFSNENGKIKKTFEERTVDLKDITGTGYKRINPIHLLITSILLLVIGFSLITYSNNMDIESETTYDYDSAEYEAYFDNVYKQESIKEGTNLVGWLFLITFVILLLVYFFKRHNLFEISFAGGNISFETSLYNKSEIDNFQKQLRLAKDNYSVVYGFQTKAESIQKKDSNVGIADELKKYAELLHQHIITQEEFEKMKRSLLKNEV